MLGDPNLAVQLRTQFKLPVLVGPMFLVSGGQGVGDVERVEPAAGVIDRMTHDYDAARAASQQRAARRFASVGSQ